MAEYENYSGGADASAGLLGGFNAGLRAQQQNFNQQQTLIEQVNKNANDLFATAAAVAKANMEAGNPPSAAANQIHSLQSAAVELLTNAANRGMLGPNGAQIITAVNQRFAALGGLPGPQQAQVAAAKTPAQPAAAPAQPQLSQSEVITPSQVAAANPPAPQPMTPNQQVAQGFDALGGGNDAPLPSGAKPVQSTANLKASDIPIGSAKTRTMIENGITTQNSLDYRAELWLLDPNSVKGIARGKEGAAITNAVIERGTEIAAARGIAPGETIAQGSLTGSSRKALDQIVKVSNAIETFENTAVKNGDMLVQLAQKVDKTGIPIIERYTRPARQLMGDTDVSQFKTQMTLWRAEVAKILTNPNLTGVLTDEARREVAIAIRDDSSFQQIRAANELLKRDFANRTAANQDQISKIMNSFSQRNRPQEQTKDLTNNPPRPQSNEQEKQRLKEKYGLK